jgi:hypothetical protein
VLLTTNGLNQRHFALSQRLRFGNFLLLPSARRISTIVDDAEPVVSQTGRGQLIKQATAVARQYELENGKSLGSGRQ